MLPPCNDRLDQELAGWFSQRGGAWSGTAAELLTSVKAKSNVDSSLWPESSRILYAHLQSHKQILQSLGMDVLLHQGFPRMVSLRRCVSDQPLRSPSDTTGIDRMPDPPANLSSVVKPQKTSPSDSGDLAQTASQVVPGGIPTTEPEYGRRPARGKFADANNFERRVFDNTGEALFAIVEMRRRIREQSLDLESAVDLVIGPAQEITRSCGITVGFLPRKRIGFEVRRGGHSSADAQNFHANLFQSILMAGEAVQVRDAQQHPLLGASCRREGIGSLIIVPIFCNQAVTGAMEFLFPEKRSFSPGDVMDFGLIAGVISESLGGAIQVGVKQAEGRERTPPTESFKSVELQPERRLPEPTLNEKPDSAEALASIEDSSEAETATHPIDFSIPESIPMRTIGSRPAMAPVLLWLALKRAWARCLSSM
jgi:hypothetical protein